MEREFCGCVPGCFLPYSDHSSIPDGGAENPYNCMAHYRQEKNLYFQELADLLEEKNVHLVEQACRAECAYEKFVRKLAQIEGLTVEGFKLIYREGELL